MPKNNIKDKAIALRLKGNSYSQIMKKLGTSKSTLSGWLKKYPLNDKRLRELRDNNPIRIDKYKKTMAIKRQKHFDDVFEEVKKEIGNMNKRETLIAGLFLYWGEGLKASRYSTSVSNTDPAVLKFFIKWLVDIFKVDKKVLRVKLHLYEDMNELKEISFWIKELGLSKNNFIKSYVKRTAFRDINYRSTFGHGTCNVYYYDKYVSDYVSMALKYIRKTVN